MQRLEKLICIPTLKEAEKIFPSVTFSKNRYGIYYKEMRSSYLLITGIGKTNTTFSLSIFLRDYFPDEVCMAGICGAYKNSGLVQGDLVSIQNDYFADEGILLPDSEFRLLSEMSVNGIDFKSVFRFNVFERMKVVDANTVSFLSGTDNIADLYYNKTKASVENMEGAAFGFVAERLNLSAYQVRAVSNFCGSRDKQDWNIGKAFACLGDFVLNYVS